MLLWYHSVHRFFITVDTSQKNKLCFKGEITGSHIFYMKKEAYWVLYQTLLFEAGPSFSARYSDKNLFPHCKAKLEQLIVLIKLSSVHCLYATPIILIPNECLRCNERLYIYGARKRRKWVIKKLKQIFLDKKNVTKVAEVFSSAFCSNIFVA